MGLTIADIGEVVSKERRQAVIHCLRGRSEVPRDRIVGWVYQDEGCTVQAARVSLHQVHLPKLDDMGVVEYDEEEKTVRRGKHFSEVSDSLRELENRNNSCLDWL